MSFFTYFTWASQNFNYWNPDWRDGFSPIATLPWWTFGGASSCFSFSSLSRVSPILGRTGNPRKSLWWGIGFFSKMDFRISIRGSVRPSIRHATVEFPSWDWTKDHGEYDIRQFEGRFRDKYASRSPERIRCQTCLPLFAALSHFFVNVGTANKKQS